MVAAGLRIRRKQVSVVVDVVGRVKYRESTAHRSAGVQYDYRPLNAAG